MGAKRCSSMRGRARFRKTSTQLLCISLAFLGVTRNSDWNRLPWGSRSRNTLFSLGRVCHPTPSPTLCPTWPRHATGFLRGNQVILGNGPVDGAQAPVFQEGKDLGEG